MSFQKVHGPFSKEVLGYVMFIAENVDLFFSVSPLKSEVDVALF